MQQNHSNGTTKIRLKIEKKKYYRATERMKIYETKSYHRYYKAIVRPQLYLHSNKSGS